MFPSRDSIKMSVSSSSSSSQQPEAAKTTHASRIAQLNIFETCLIVTVLFFVCWITVELALFLYIIGFYPDVSNNHYVAGRLLVLLNSCLNPYVYTIRYREFKKQIRVILGVKVIDKLETSMTYTK